jgi:hypothetical protein
VRYCMQMRRLTLGVAVLVATVFCREGKACKCTLVKDLQELTKDHVVFAGRAMEQLNRCWDDSVADRDEFYGLSATSAVTRFRVTHARALVPNSDVLVFARANTHCAPSFHVGDEYLVVATMRGGHLVASKCPILFEDMVNEVRAYLGVPAESAVGLRQVPPPSGPRVCSRPASLGEAMARADAVVWSDSQSACVLGDSSVVEHAVVIAQRGR